MKKIFIIIIGLMLLTPPLSARELAPSRARQIRTDTSNFDTNLSSADTTVQAALETIDEMAGAGGTVDDDVTVNSTAIDTTANFLDNIYIDFAVADGGAGGPDDVTAKPNYNAASGDHALSANECAYAANGLVCEGATADTIELYLQVPDPATTDKTLTFPNVTDTIAVEGGNIATATALAADPADCGANTFATTIAASGALTCSQVLQNQIGDATGNSTINMDGYDLNYIFDNPSGAFNITANGAYTSHGVFTVKQQTGNPGTSHLVHLEASDTDVSLIHTKHTIDSGSIQHMIFEGNRATPTNNDELYNSWIFSDSAGNQDEFARISWIASDVTSTSEDGGITWDLIQGGSLTEVMTLSSTGALAVTGALSGSNLSGTNTGDNTVATSGDSATSFFSSGTLEDARLPTSQAGKTFTSDVTLGDNSSGDVTLTFDGDAGTDGAIFYDVSTDEIAISKTDDPDAHGEAALNVKWSSAAFNSSYVNLGVYSLLTNTGTNTGLPGHIVGLYGDVLDTASGDLYMYGVEGRAQGRGNATGNTYIGAYGLGLCQATSCATNTIIGVQGKVEITTDGTTPLAEGTAVTFNAPAITGGGATTKYSFLGEDNLRVGGYAEIGGAAGVRMTGDGDGAITLLGQGDGFDEDLKINLDDVSNEIGFLSSTGVNRANFVGMTLVADGIDADGAVDMDYGSADVTDHTFATDGTGTAEIVLPAGAIDSTEILDATVAGVDLAANTKVVSFGITIDGGGSAITTGVKGYVEIPFAMTITGWTILADQSGSIVVDVWKDTYANYPPTVADTIAGTEKPTITTATKGQDLTLSSWTTAVTAGDIIGFNVDSITTVQRVHLIIRGNKT